MKEHQKLEHPAQVKTKSFEDAAFEMLSTVSPIKLPRDEIPFDSVREIVLGEVRYSNFRKKKSQRVFK